MLLLAQRILIFVWEPYLCCYSGRMVKKQEDQMISKGHSNSKLIYFQ